MEFLKSLTFRRVSAIASAVGFVCSIYVIYLSFNGFANYTSPLLILLYIAALPLFGLLIITLSIRMKSIRVIFKHLPIWCIGVIIVASIIVPINFLLCINNLEWGLPGVVNGEYVIHNHGDIIKTLTKEEYDYKQSVLTRMIMGNVALFYFVPMLCFGFLREVRVVEEKS